MIETMNILSLIRSQLLEECIIHMEEANVIYLLVSFVMHSGVRLLMQSLKQAAERGADIKILTGDYLYVTQPEALTQLLLNHDNIEIRLWKSRGNSFHPKAYLFHKPGDQHTVIIGSSNLSASALQDGVEWNLSVAGTDDTLIYNEAEHHFLSLFYHERTVPINPITINDYQQSYAKFHLKHPQLLETWLHLEDYPEVKNPHDHQSDQSFPAEVVEAPGTYVTTINPRPVQQEALEQLRITQTEGYDKALVVMATGLGKTILAAFFAREFRRVLFVAHRDEILQQAQQAFNKVSPDRSSGFFTGQEKNTEATVIFASVFTLASKRHRAKFDAHAFDLVVIDEFHHASASTYQSILQGFHPNFLLGITATPYRTDGRDIFALCDGNLAYSLDFLEAIGRGWLAPFHYYGVYDDTDYSAIRWLGNAYDEDELYRAQTRKTLADAILAAWREHAQSRGIAFCSSVAQAQFLSNHFQQHGIAADILHGGSPASKRSQVIQKLTQGELTLLFTVDLFNEGVDIPCIDTLLFVRPTESLTVFVQQLGRGLRIHEGKTHCTIIDLIGNYRNADSKLSVFYNNQLDQQPAVLPETALTASALPLGCEMHLATKVIDLLEIMRTKKHPRKALLIASFHKVKADLGRRPTYLEMHLLGSCDSREYKQEYGGYFHFLSTIGELTEAERLTLESIGSWLREVESTSMSKAYKMVLLHAMLSRGEDKWFEEIEPTEAALPFYAFYHEKKYRLQIDFATKNTEQWHVFNEKRMATHIKQNPIKFWSQSSQGFAFYEEGKFGFRLAPHPEAKSLLHAWTSQICEYRLHAYFERKGATKEQSIDKS